jgi:glycine/D-amino acid oxidase-like deaminating enzyme
LKQTPEGRIVIGSDHDGAPRSEATQERGEQLLAAGARLLPQLASVELERVTLGWRPLPRDGYPIVGFAPRAPGVYVAVTHSGVILAPMLAQLASLEILDRVDVELLEPYRLARFSAATASPTA